MNDFSNVIKGQKVARRQSYPIQGNTVLGVKQTPAHRRPSAAVYRQTGERIAPVTPPPLPRQFAPSHAAASPRPAVLQPSAAQPVIVQSVPVIITDTSAETAPSERITVFIRVLPKILSATVIISALGFLAYHALLWQNNVYLVQPAPDVALRQRMLDFAATGNTTKAETDLAPASAELTTSGTFAWQSYRVRRGDTVSKIAAAHSLSMDAIIASNKMVNVRKLREGDMLRIPNMDGIPYTIVEGDVYEKVSEKFGVPLDAILDANDVQTGEMIAGEQIFIPGARMPAEDLRRALGEAFIYPIRGRLSSSFGWRKDPFTGVRSFHKGIDIVAEVGVPVKAAMAGKVSMVGFSPVLGKYIIITHNNTYQTMYAHLNATTAVRGARVAQGDTIGEVGSTGYSTGPHLHFVIYKNGREVNPLEQLKL